MPWIKQGRIFNLEPNLCRTTHAQVPTPYVMEDRIRVYYACRDTHNQSYPAYFDLSKDLKTVLKIHETSVMERGKPGMFDANGIMPSCVIKNGDELWLYYIGWNALRGDGARYQNEIGLAISKDDGESFQRMFEGPIMGRSPIDPGLVVMPLVTKDGDIFKMWYQSGTGWNKVGDQYEPTYVIKYAESTDGLRWDRNPIVCVNTWSNREAISRPCISGEDMWYCKRGSSDYRLGKESYSIEHAVSNGSLLWSRKEDVTIERDNWDSYMQCYPFVFKFDDKQVMLYNGNDFGQTGIGVAVWQP